MGYLQPIRTRKEFIRDAAGKPVGVREVRDTQNAPPIRRSIRLDTDGTAFGASWTPGYLATQAGRDQLQTMLAVQLPGLLARCYDGAMSPELAAWAQSVVAKACAEVDADEGFIPTLPIPIHPDTSMAHAVEIKAAVEDAAAAALQRGVTVAMAALVGSLGLLRTAPDSTTPATPGAPDRNDEVLDKFKQLAGDSAATADAS